MTGKCSDTEQENAQRALATLRARLKRAQEKLRKIEKKQGRTEEALAESERRFRSTLEAMEDAIYICSPDFRIEYMNSAMIRRIGEDAIGKRCYEAIHGGRDKCPWCVHDKIMRGETVKTEVVKTQDSKTFSISNNPIFHSDGSIRKLTVYHDVTEIKRIEERLQQAQKMEAIGTLAGGIAHDFNNILSPIMIRTEMILADLPDQSHLRTSLEKIFKASERARDLVRQILAFSRQHENERKPLSIGPIIKEVIKLVRASLPSTIDIRLGIRAEKDTVMADPVQIHQVLMNLCTNAFHAMCGEGGVLTVALDNPEIDGGNADLYPEIRPGKYVRLMVSDTGHGMKPEIRERIFEPYFTTKGKGDGTGLGLAVVHGIVKSSDGFIFTDSEPGLGTTFNLFFPLIETPVPIEPKERRASVAKGSEHLLIVDDENPIINAMTLMLTRLGYRITTYQSSLDCLNAFMQKPEAFDVLITDLTMPDLTGTQLAKKVRSIREDIPIILCTGFGDAIDSDQAKTVGIDAMLMKPILRQQMADTIRHVLENRK